MKVDVNEHERQSKITLGHKLKVTEPLVVRRDKDVNENERKSNLTLRNKFK